ncbi:spatacsin-like [Teleopsis dalmanni]|uniref:spatacsin-like n=1 Tax=Teleopsis dalmanni TaxID=139649 RepID=UPI0018CF05B1|nr:spatacsin-like [Teleopsis dalmanni]
MNPKAREKILKSWASLGEVQLIKEVATKGENIDLCIEYWSKKRKIPIPEYELFFHDVVQTYVQRLLIERLVYKAENVLRNVQRDVKCFYFQFANECDNAELRELLFDYMQKKATHNFEKEMQDLQLNWELLQQIQLCPEILSKYKQLHHPRISLESLVTLNTSLKQQLMAELYYNNKNQMLLNYLNKNVFWNFLVDSKNETELIRWYCAYRDMHKDEDSSSHVAVNGEDLVIMYGQWIIETPMYEYALKELKEPDEVLRNCFAIAGYFFRDERNGDPLKMIKRICTTESFEINKAHLEKVQLGSYLLDNKYYALLLQNFVSVRELEELCEEKPDDRPLLELIVDLKKNDLNEFHGFKMIVQSTSAYLEQNGIDVECEQPLATFYEFLCNEPTIASLQCFLLSNSLQIPYLNSLRQRFKNCGIEATINIPSPFEFLQKFKNINFKEICYDVNEVVSFSNERLCQKYAPKYQLNFLHYVKQHRSAYAVYYLLTNQLQHYAQITKSQLFRACESVTKLALQHMSDADLVAHCVGFIEMLGFDTQHLRCVIKLCHFIESDCIPHYEELIKKVEYKLTKQLEANNTEFPITGYQALMHIVNCNQQRYWPTEILQQYANNNDWWRILILIQYFEIPLDQIKLLKEAFESKTMGEHLLRSLSNDRPTTKRKNSICRLKKQTKTGNAQTHTSDETLTSSVVSCTDGNIWSLPSNMESLKYLLDTSDRPDIFALILLSTTSIPENLISKHMKFIEIMIDKNIYDTSTNLLKNSIKYGSPMLALLSAMVSTTNLGWCWFVWVIVSTGQWLDIAPLTHKDTNELFWHTLESTVRSGYTTTLYQSFYVFFEDNPMQQFFNFLSITQKLRDFSAETVHELRLFLLAWSNEEIELPLSIAPKKDELILRCTKLLLIHLEHNFDSSLDQQKFLNCICSSDMSDISSLLDFCLLSKVFDILQSTKNYSSLCALLNFEHLLKEGIAVYRQLLKALLAEKEFDLAVRLATLLHLPISDIIYSKWVENADNDNLKIIPLQQYENEIAEHAIPPSVLVNFFLYVASRIETNHACKYELLKNALNVIKRHHLFPNESFDRDEIEYDMVICYLHIESLKTVENLEIYHSEYFEEIMLKERCVLYKSFLELKELAGIEDLNVHSKKELSEELQSKLIELIYRLLDEGDIVEALRIQELFKCRPIDLRFVVFCMALAEGITTIFNMVPEERQLLSDIEKSSFAKFNKRTLEDSPSSIQSIIDFSDSDSTLEFEEIPSKHKRDTLETIQGIASKLKHGVDMAKRVVMVYRAAMYLDKEYLDILRTKDANVLLKSVTAEECMHRLLVVSDILNSTQMTPQEIADLLAFEIATAIVRPRFYIFNADQHSKNCFKNAELWGYNIDRDFHLFLELTSNTTKLGNCLLDYCDALKTYRKFQDNKPYEHNAVFEKLLEIIALYGLPVPTTLPTSTSNEPPQVLSHKKQNLIYVELLIKAHQCFVNECSMEGIANVLNRAKALNVILTKAKSWSLIVRMLIGIARYREMFYCFNSLIENEQFESLLGQFDKEKTVALRQAIVVYLREYCPTNSRELFKLAALHFLMHKDLAEMWEQDAQAIISNILTTAKVTDPQLLEQTSTTNLLASNSNTKTIIPKLSIGTEIITLLHNALDNYTHAAENYLLDNKLLSAQKSAYLAEMIAMQIDLATKALNKTTTPHLCVCVINVQSRDEFRDLVNIELSVPQTLILSRALGFDVNWTEAILSQYVISNKKTYLSDYLAYLDLNDGIITNIVKGYQIYLQQNKATTVMEENLAHLIEYVKSITLKYKLASILTLKGIVMSLINDHTIYYLRDTNFGRNENQNMPDI